MKSAASPALGLPLGADKKIAPVRAARKRPRRQPRPATAEARLRDLGFTPKMAYAMRSWMGLNTLEKDWTPEQLAYQGLCSPSTFSRARKNLLEAGLIFEASSAIFDAVNSENNRAALYRFTEKAYRLVSPRGHRLAKRTSPEAFVVPISRSQSHVQPHHKDHPGVDVVAKEPLQEDQKRLQEALLAPEGPNLNPGGAKTAAAAMTPHEASRLVEAGRGFLELLFEEIRPQATKSPQALLVARLKSPSFRRDILASAQAYIRRRDAAIAAGDVASLNPGDLTPSTALAAWKVAAKRVPPASFAGYSSAYDLERSAWKACLSVARVENPAKAAQIEAAVASRLEVQGILSGSLIWSRAFAHQVAKDLAEATPWLRAHSPDSGRAAAEGLGG